MFFLLEAVEFTMLSLNLKPRGSELLSTHAQSPTKNYYFDQDFRKQVQLKPICCKIAAFTFKTEDVLD